MNKVKIISDSTCDLGLERAKELDVRIVPLYVTFNEESYLDGETIKTQDVYDKVAEKGYLPKTAAVTQETFYSVFKEYLEEGYDIVFTGISKQMSRTYESAVLAARELDESRIFVVDSMNLSTGIGLLVLKACKFRDEGKSAKEIADLLNDLNKRVKSQFAIETMDYLYKGGRCSGMAKFFGTLLKIKPVIFVRNGKMGVGKKPIGKMKIALDAMVDMILDDKAKDNIDLDHIFITDSIAPQSFEYLDKRLKEEFPGVDIIHTTAGCVIASHCGPGTIGILYITKDLTSKEEN